MYAGGHSTQRVSELQDPFKDPLDPFMDAGRRTASANGDADATQASGDTCASRGAQEVGQAARQAGLLRPRLGAIQNARGASLDRAVAHDRAPRPCHQLRSAPLAARRPRRSSWTRGRRARARRSHGCGGTPRPSQRRTRAVPLVGGHRRIKLRAARTTQKPLRHGGDRGWIAKCCMQLLHAFPGDSF